MRDSPTTKEYIVYLYTIKLFFFFFSKIDLIFKYFGTNKKILKIFLKITKPLSGCPGTSIYHLWLSSRRRRRRRHRNLSFLPLFLPLFIMCVLV